MKKQKSFQELVEQHQRTNEQLQKLKEKIDKKLFNKINEQERVLKLLEGEMKCHEPQSWGNYQLLAFASRRFNVNKFKLVHKQLYDDFTVTQTIKKIKIVNYPGFKK